MENKPTPKRYGSITERSAWWTSAEGKAEADRIETKRQQELPKPQLGGLVGWVLEKLRDTNRGDAESVQDDFKKS